MRKKILTACAGLAAVLVVIAAVGIAAERHDAEFRAQVAHAQVMADIRPMPDNPDKCRPPDPCWVGSSQDRRHGGELHRAYALAGWLHVDSYQGIENCWFLFDTHTGRSMMRCYPPDGSVSGGYSSPG